MHGYKYMQQLASYIYLLCIIITDYEKKLQRIWKKNPCHVVQARIKRFTIHLGSFHSLKPGGLLNDEVVIALLCILNAHSYIQIINGYLELLASVNGRCRIIISQTMTSIVNCVAVAQRFHLLSKVALYN